MVRIPKFHFTYIVSAYPFGSRAQCTCGWMSWRAYSWPDESEEAAKQHEAKKGVATWQ